MNSKFKKRAAIAYVLLAVFLVSAIANPVFANPKENRKTNGERIWEGYYKSQVSVRYHLEKAGDYETFDFAAKIAMFSSSLLALCLTIYFANKRASKNWKNGLLIFEGVVLTASMVLVMMGFGRSAALHDNICNDWQALSHEWDSAREARKHSTDEKLGHRLTVLLDKERAIEEREPKGSFDVDLMREKQKEFNYAQGLAVASVTKSQ